MLAVHQWCKQSGINFMGSWERLYLRGIAPRLPAETGHCWWHWGDTGEGVCRGTRVQGPLLLGGRASDPVSGPNCQRQECPSSWVPGLSAEVAEVSLSYLGVPAMPFPSSCSAVVLHLGRTRFVGTRDIIYWSRLPWQLLPCTLHCLPFYSILAWKLLMGKKNGMEGDSTLENRKESNFCHNTCSYWKIKWKSSSLLLGKPYFPGFRGFIIISSALLPQKEK